MTILYINTGSSANKGDGDTLRTAFNKINANFSSVINDGLTAALPSQAGHTGEFLTTDGAGTLSWSTATGGSSSLPADGVGYLSNDGAGNLTWSPVASTFNGGTITNALIITDATQSVSDITGALQVTGGVGIGGNLNTHGVLYVGAGANATPLYNPTFIGRAAGQTYIQAALVNTDGRGSADWVAYGDNGNTEHGWVDMGFTGSSYNDPDFTITNEGEGYVFVAGAPDGISHGSLVFATHDTGIENDIVFATGGFQRSNEKMRFINSSNQFWIETTTTSISTTTGALRVSGGVGIGGDIYAGGTISVGPGQVREALVNINGTTNGSSTTSVLLMTGYGSNSQARIIIDHPGSNYAGIGTGAQGTAGLVFGLTSSDAPHSWNQRWMSITQTGLVTVESYVASTSSVTGALVVNGGVGIGGDLYAGDIYSNGVKLVNGGAGGATIDLLNVDSDILPALDSHYNLGSPTQQWKSLYVSTNTIYINNVPLTIDTATNVLQIGGTPSTTATNIATENFVTELVATVTVGPKGDPGSTWLTGSGLAPAPGTNPGDQYLDADTGNIYQWDGETWTYTGNIKGPQGDSSSGSSGTVWTNDANGCLRVELSSTGFEAFTEESHVDLQNSGTWSIGSYGYATFIGNDEFDNVNILSLRSGDDTYITTNLRENGNHQWKFGTDGVITLPSGNTRIGNVFGTDAIIGNTGTSVGVLVQGQGGAGGVQWVDNPDNIGSSGTQIAAVVVNSPLASSTGTVQIVTGVSTTSTIGGNTWEFGADGTLTLPTDGNILNRDGDVLLSSKISTPVNINLDGGGASTIYEETSLLFADGGFASTRRSVTDPLFDAGANGAGKVYGANDNLINGGGA